MSRTRHGGWGYSRDEAIIFIRRQFPRPASPDFVSLEQHIAQKIIFEELIIFQPQEARFAGIDVQLKSQGMETDQKRKYDRINLTITCLSDPHWEGLSKEWEENEFGRRDGFDVQAHLARRQACQIEYERELWFDITDVFDRLQQQ